MMWLCFVLFVAMANAAVLTTPSVEETNEMKAPILLSLIAQDPYGFKLLWEAVENNEDDPILGYKVKVWQQPKKMVYKYERINGVKFLVQESNVPSKFPLDNEIPVTDPKEILITKPDVHEASSKGMEPGVIYEFRVQAFTKRGDGPLSAPMRLQFLKPDNNDSKKDMYTIA